MATNPLNALMFGSESDGLFLGELGVDLDSVTLGGQIPSDLEDVGWLSEDGIKLGIEDSTGSIKGHQGGGVVKQFMESSETSIEAVFLESKLKTFQWFFNTKGKKSQESAAVGKSKDVTTFEIPSARRAIDLCGIADLYDTSNPETRFRFIFPHLTLGAREAIEFKIGEITAYKMPLQIIGGFKLLTNHSGLMASA